MTARPATRHRLDVRHSAGAVSELCHFAQLRIKAFGYGLTSGSDLEILRDELADSRLLNL